MLVILLVNGTGFYIYYIIQLQSIKAEMRQALKRRPDHELEILTLTQRQFEDALVEEDEIRVAGKMYDIARIERSGDDLRIYCLHDEKEENLLALLQEIVSKPLKDRSSMPVAIMDFLALNFILPFEDIVFKNSSTAIQSGSFYQLPLDKFFHDILTPPPRG
jgi:Fic family protein